MLRKKQSMKRKHAKKLLEEISVIFGMIDVKKVESSNFEEKTVYYLDDVISFVRDDNGLYPFLASGIVDSLPRVVVDMGAIRFICNGADVMAPGITKMDDFQKDDFVVVRDVTHGKALVLGRAMKSSMEINASKKGKVIKNLHYVGDKLWNAV